MPIPAIPNPLNMYSKKSIQTAVTIPDESTIRGVKNKDNIIIVFTTMVVLAFRPLLWVLK
jgi:hypothetical protein